MTDRELLELLVQKVINLEQNMATNTDLAEVKQSLVRIEQEQGTKIAALFDAREIQMDANERIINALNRIENKVDKTSLKVAAHDSALKRAK